MLSLSLTSDFEALSKGLSDIQRKQVPFAASRTLNALALRGRDQVRHDLPRHFTPRASLPWEQKGVLFTSTTKRAMPMQVEVYDRHWYMAQQETGGERFPQSSAHLAVPIGIRGDKREMIRYQDRPRQILGRKSAEAFLITLASGKQLILQRVGKGREGNKVLYDLETSVHLRPRFEMEATVISVVRLNVSAEFERQLDFAVSTRK